MKNNYSEERREFLKKSGLVTLGGLLVPSFLKANSLLSETWKGKNLIVIQLSGGNDGLNTVVPFRNDLYYKARPNLAIEAGKVLKLTDDLGLNPAMTGLKKIYDAGDLSIINNVGYPNPNRSHFLSMDIWQSAGNNGEHYTSGWLGRYLDHECMNGAPHDGIEVNEMLSLAMKGAKRKGVPVANPGKFYNATRGIEVNKMAGDSANDAVKFLYKTMADTKESAEYIFQKSKVYKSKKSYPNNKFGNQLKNIAQFICSGLETRVYYTSLGGFDTHNNQKNRQSNLLKTYSDSLEALVDELKENDQWKNTLVLTFSEFGRRVEQNGSAGTDHGKANNSFVMGGSLKKAGVYNAVPDLANLDKGDLKHQIDFRQIYSTILDRWMESDSGKILNGSYEKLSFL